MQLAALLLSAAGFDSFMFLFFCYPFFRLLRNEMEKAFSFLGLCPLFIRLLRISDLRSPAAAPTASRFGTYGAVDSFFRFACNFSPFLDWKVGFTFSFRGFCSSVFNLSLISILRSRRAGDSFLVEQKGIKDSHKGPAGPLCIPMESYPRDVKFDSPARSNFKQSLRIVA